MDNRYCINNLKNRGKELTAVSLKTAENRRQIGKAYWETILGMNAMLNNRLVIIPKRNMVTNIGLDENSTHGADIRLIPKKVRQLFNMPVWKQSFPINHPPYVVLDEEYYKDMRKLNGWGSPLTVFLRKIGYFFKCIRYGKIKRLLNSFKRKISNK